jgi:hypothetical protein
MTSSSEYHVFVRRFLPFPVALLGVALLGWASTAVAQTNGAAGSGHPVTGAVISPTGPVNPPTGPVRPPTGTLPSVNPGGYVPNSQVTFSGNNRAYSNDGRHRHHSHGGYAFPFLYAVPVPYGVDPDLVDAPADNSANADDDANYQGGPTVFDRRGYGAESYVPPVEDSFDDSARRADATPALPEAPQLTTVLVFKDGHTVELGNYAIVGANLFDLTPGHTRKVPLADIDLAATQRQNDDRGVTFALPTSPQAN